MDSGEIKLYLINILGNSEVSEARLNLLMEKYKCADYKEVLEKEIAEKRILVKKQKRYHLTEKGSEKILNDLESRGAHMLKDIALVREFIKGFSADEGSFVFNTGKEDFKQEIRKNIEGGIVEEKKDEETVYSGNYDKNLVNLVDGTLKQRKISVEDEDLAKLSHIFGLMKAKEILDGIYKILSEKPEKVLFFNPAVEHSELTYSDMEESRHAYDIFSSADVIKNSEEKEFIIGKWRREESGRGGRRKDSDIEGIVLTSRSNHESHEEDFKAFLDGFEYSRIGNLIQIVKDEIHLSPLLAEFALKSDAFTKETTGQGVTGLHRKNTIFDIDELKFIVKDNKSEALVEIISSMIKKYIENYNADEAVDWGFKHFPVYS